MARKLSTIYGGENSFILSLGSTGSKTFQLATEYPSGGYTIALSSSDSTFDIYFVNSSGESVGYSSGSKIVASERFDKVSVIGTANGEVLSFTYSGLNSSPSIASLDSGAGPILTSVSDNSLIDIDDTTTISGKNFASDIEIVFVGSDATNRPAKNIIRSSSTSLIVTRPDSMPAEYSPYSIYASNPGVENPTGSNSHILENYISSGTGPVWTTSQTQYYRLGGQANSQISLVAPDSDLSSINFSVQSGSIPNGLSLNGTTGVISGTYSGSANENDSSTVIIRATDTGGNFLDRTFTFIANALPSWSTAAGALSSVSASAGYSYQLSASFGSVGSSISYSIASGSLPTGVSLSSSGLISGLNDGTISTYTFTVRATDSLGAYSDREFSIQVTSPPTKITTLSYASYNTPINDVAIDSSGNVYANASYQDPNNVSGASWWGQVKFDTNLSITKTSINQNNQSYGGPGNIDVDNSGNIYAYGMDGQSGYKSLVRKWSPNMDSVLWEKQHAAPQGQAYPYDGRLSPNKNYFLASSQSYWNGGVFYPCHWAFDASGNVLWTKRWTDANDSPVRISFMNNGSCILKNGTQAYFRRHNTVTGAYENQTWRFTVSGNTDQNRVQEMVFTSDDNYYYVLSTSGTSALVSKFSTTGNGAAIWGRKLTNGTSQCGFNNMVIDPVTGNLVIGGYALNSSNYIGIVLCLDSSGNTVYMRQLDSPGTAGNNLYISQIVGRTLYVSAGFDSPSRGAFFSMPIDGSTATGSATAGSFSFGFTSTSAAISSHTSITVEYSTNNAGSTANDVSISSGDTSYRSVSYTTNTATFA